LLWDLFSRQIVDEEYIVMLENQLPAHEKANDQSPANGICGYTNKVRLRGL
jgi:hypothetical protein